MNARKQRSLIACERCKRRKTKCNGVSPVCSSCEKAKADCFWPPTARASVVSSVEDSHLLNYVADLERKIAELQNQLQAQARHFSPNITTSSVRDGSLSTQLAPRVDSDSNPVAEGGLPVETALLSIGATAEPLFAGPTSGVSISRMVQGIIGRYSPQNLEEEREGRHRNISDIQPSASSESTTILPSATLSASEEDTLVKLFFSKVHPRYPILDKVSFYEAYAQRHQAPQQAQPLDAAFMFFVNMIYAIGSRILQLHFNSSMKHDPESHYARALSYTDAALGRKSLHRVQALLLMAVFLIRAPGSTGSLSGWHIVGFAMRNAVELGFHRNSRQIQGCNLYDIEIRKRVFWTAYALDRALSLTLGRPFAIADYEIDISLPVDINDDITDLVAIQDRLCCRESLDGETYLSGQTRTTLSSFIQICRLRQIESRIQQKIYGANRAADEASSRPEAIENFRRELDTWRSNTTKFIRNETDAQNLTSVYDMDEFFSVQYNKALLMLLQPGLVNCEQRPGSDTKSTYLILCARASGEICQSYKAMHQKQPLGWNLLALHSVFTAGLSLLYCMWIDKEKRDLKIVDDIRACSSVLFVVAEHWPTACRFRDAFERMVSRMFEILSKDQGGERRDADHVDENPSFGLQDQFGHDYMVGNDEFWSVFDQGIEDDNIWDQFRYDANILPTGDDWLAMADI